MTTALITLLTFAAAALMARSLARPGARLYVLDVPDEGSLHQQPTPRTGGLAIVTLSRHGTERR